MDNSAIGSTSHVEGDAVFPICPEELKPHVGMTFTNVEQAEKFYEIYAVACGFQIRKSTSEKKDGKYVRRYVVCNKAGFKSATTTIEADTETFINKKRRMMETRIGCRAHIKIRLEAAFGYVCTCFVEDHNHAMISEGYKHLMKSNKNITPAHKMMIAKCRRANIGPMRAFRFFKELVGTYEDVGCTNVEFKNYARDTRAFANGVDAEILLQKLESKRDFSPGFTFGYSEDEFKQVKSLFWADQLSILNYSVFGEAVSFDATYSTNRYKMIFAPFTGRDNRGRCVTFGAGLLTREDYESYSWLLSKFAESMKSHPKILITDEDPALKKAVADIFPNTKHRLCMWHIMRKVAEKVPNVMGEDPDFKDKLHSLVWSELNEPIEFEEKWVVLMNEYGLSDHRWFTKLFSMRSSWIPAYFRDMEMSGLFKTTSLSESENSFFGQYLNINHDLAEFYMQFGSAIDAQRHAHNKLCFKDQNGTTVVKSHFPIEKDAASTYTCSIFHKVQREIEAAVHQCRILSMVDQPDQTLYVVAANDGLQFQVRRTATDDTFSCSCKYYIRKGLLCRHIFVMMFNMNVKTIPKKYICRRWTKAASVEIGQLCESSGYSHPSGNNELFAEAFKCIGLVDGNPECKAELLQIFRDASAKFALGNDQLAESDSPRGNEAMFEQYYGLPKPKTIRLVPPEVCNTKGSVIQKKSHREKSNREKAIAQANKPLRNCRRCDKLTNHDSRNCPLNKK